MAVQEKWRYEGVEELGSIADKLLKVGEDSKVWIFEGDLGAGKTTLIKALCEKLGVVDNVSSPTFALVNEYETYEQETVYHFDFYRIKKEIEASDIGIEEYFDSGCYCFVEWPSKIPSLIPDDHLKIEIVPLSETKRELLITKK